MARSFTEHEKENIKKSLKEACKHSWTQYGYKKTSVDELCKQAGISKGAFYIFLNQKKLSFVKFYVLYKNKYVMLLQRLSDNRKINMGLQKH